ncbi:hypothetical protein CANCADRAFT_141581 [Tortispora caseinolytica NRRL Y-17796]|uniref:Enoyl reductase (ER) domain-containing protein n=1 Tax=Tortispora caseinolytica NRRL Y-17796 TaxID=767744 RepID=A0A1E4TCZ0_9ASCO|nr:hypothetical protein CANCADRAFT_141581 [Tortispora caseinolytica NRRL Y-17796]
MKAIVISNSADVKTKPSPGLWHPIETIDIEKPVPKSNEVLVKISAVALNHRDVFSRQSLYPGVLPGVPLFADGMGTVTDAGSDSLRKQWVGKRVIVAPSRGWVSDRRAPDTSHFAILGGTKMLPVGTGCEYVACTNEEFVECPAHLSDSEAAALPLAGLTAWRATFTKGELPLNGPAKNVLITGIGGGVAVFAAIFAVHAGHSVYVTSSSKEKIDGAIERLGVKGGFNYKDKDWPDQVKKALGGALMDVVVDGAGADIATKAIKFCRPGAIISCYGMTAGPQIAYTMRSVLSHMDVRGSTMGSFAEFKDMVKFVDSHKVKPLVSHQFSLDDVEKAFLVMRDSQQFGKIVVTMTQSSSRL